MNDVNETTAILMGLEYQKNAFTADEIASIQHDVEENGIRFEARETNRIIMAASIDEMFAALTIFLSSGGLHEIVQAVSQSAIYDALKASVKRIWMMVKAKDFAKITASSIEKTEPQVHLYVDGHTLVFPKNLDSEVANHFIDKAFEYIEKIECPQQVYVFYNKKKDRLEQFTEQELLQQAIRKHAKKSQ